MKKLLFEPCHEKTGFFAYAKTKPQISCAVTAQLISAFVFATQIVQSLFILNSKFQASSHLLWLYSPVCVGSGRKPRRPVFSQRGSFYSGLYHKNSTSWKKESPLQNEDTEGGRKVLYSEIISMWINILFWIF